LFQSGLADRVPGLADCERDTLDGFIGTAVYPIGNKKDVVFALFWETFDHEPVLADMTVLFRRSEEQFAMAETDAALPDA